MSGIYIPGMEMPTSCHECVAGYGGCCFVAQADADGICPDHGRADFCPLVPVPEHGRLIDGDALKAKQQEDADLFINAVSLAEKSRRDEALNAVANIVNAPTIIPASGGDAE